MERVDLIFGVAGSDIMISESLVLVVNADVFAQKVKQISTSCSPKGVSLCIHKVKPNLT